MGGGPHSGGKREDQRECRRSQNAIKGTDSRNIQISAAGRSCLRTSKQVKISDNESQGTGNLANISVPVLSKPKLCDKL